VGDFGVKVSLPGQDVNSAPDSQLLFNSSWPNIKIYKNIFFPTTTTAPTKTINGMTLPIIYHHGLGFVPAVIPYGNSNLNNGQGALGYQKYADINRQNIAVDNQNVYYIPSGGPAGHPDIGVMILYLDIESPYQSPNINSGTSSNISLDKDFGIRMSKDGYDIKSNDMRDYIIHSSSRSPLLHEVVPGITTGDSFFQTFSYTYDLPYNPIFLAFAELIYSGTLLNNLYVSINGYGGLSTTGNTITIELGGAHGSQRTSLVILKDPFNINDNVININL
jgi:hypothetical protein